MLPSSNLCFQLSPVGSNRSIPVTEPALRKILDAGCSVYWVRGAENRNQAKASLALDFPDINFLLMLNPESFDLGLFENEDDFLWHKLQQEFGSVHQSVMEFKTVFGNRELIMSADPENTYTSQEGLYMTLDKWIVALKFESLDDDAKDRLPFFTQKKSVWNKSSNYSITSLLDALTIMQHTIDTLMDKDSLLAYMKTEASVKNIQMRERTQNSNTYSDNDASILGKDYYVSLNGNSNLPLDYIFIDFSVIHTDSGKYLQLKPFYADISNKFCYDVGPSNLMQLASYGLDIGWSGIYKSIAHLYSESELGFSLDADYETMLSRLISSRHAYFNVDSSLFSF